MKYIVDIKDNGYLSYEIIDSSFSDDDCCICYHKGSGVTQYSKNHKRHRIDGPAIFSDDDDLCMFFIEDHNITDDVNRLIEKGILGSDWRMWNEKDISYFKLKFV